MIEVAVAVLVDCVATAVKALTPVLELWPVLAKVLSL